MPKHGYGIQYIILNLIFHKCIIMLVPLYHSVYHYLHCCCYYFIVTTYH